MVQLQEENLFYMSQLILMQKGMAIFKKIILEMVIAVKPIPKPLQKCTERPWDW